MESPSLQLYGHSDMLTVEEHQTHDWGLQQAINSGNLFGVEPQKELGAAWQIEHHLFPCLSGEWFPYVTPIVKQMLETCTMPDGNKLDYWSLWYTIERESEVAGKLVAEYAQKAAGAKMTTTIIVTTSLTEQALLHDLGFE